ncbi:hypothetical protein [Acidiphilium multivorum]|uniref:hypothetical protein n=1 Tax=Acidiphilium multivorum TaxID=62140 RepID=UPI001F4C1D50|nr:hypothetical protein [Acidiphilium multivorum]
MPKDDTANAKYRRKLRAAGATEVLVQLPLETVCLIDTIKERKGLRSRSQALQQLIEEWRGSPRTA